MADLGSVIVGALIASASGGGVQWYLHKIKVEDELRRLKATKYEELVTGLFEHQHWLKAKGRHYVFEATEPVGHSPFARVRAIGAAYFPIFRQRLYELDIAADKYELWAMQARRGKPAAGAYEQKVIDEGNAIYGVYSKLLFTLLGDLDAQAAISFKPTAPGWIARLAEINKLKG